jgi:mannitol/fructose-specific phosphotransferase system IIA component (Ntr-type)
VKLSTLLPVAQICVPLRAQSKADAIEELLVALAVPEDGRRRAIRDAVLARESELSTGIGRGVAIPHGKTAAVPRHTCAFGVAPAGIDWGAVDGLPCRIVFLCVSNPKDAGEHVRVLSQVARVLNDSRARTALESAAAPEDVRRVFLDDESREGL